MLTFQLAGALVPIVQRDASGAGRIVMAVVEERPNVNIAALLGLISYRRLEGGQPPGGHRAMNSKLQESLLFAHRANIDRYRRLLRTHLTDHERAFIKRRLAEEERALLEIGQRAAELDCANDAA